MGHLLAVGLCYVLEAPAIFDTFFIDFKSLSINFLSLFVIRFAI